MACGPARSLGDFQSRIEPASFRRWSSVWASRTSLLCGDGLREVGQALGQYGVPFRFQVEVPDGQRHSAGTSPLAFCDLRRPQGRVLPQGVEQHAALSSGRFRLEQHANQALDLVRGCTGAALQCADGRLFGVLFSVLDQRPNLLYKSLAAQDQPCESPLKGADRFLSFAGLDEGSVAADRSVSPPNCSRVLWVYTHGARATPVPK